MQVGIPKLRKTTALVCAAAVCSSSVTAVTAHAGMVATESIVEQDQAGQADAARDTISAFMARDDVRAEFRELGVDPAEADRRAMAMSDAEAIKLAGNLRQAPAGEGAIGALIGAGVLIFLVLLITDILGFTDVFNFTNKGSAG